VRGTFSVRTTETTPRVECKFEMTVAQATADGDDKIEFIRSLASFLCCPVVTQDRESSPDTTRYPEYRLVSTGAGNKNIVEYLSTYLLFSSKRLEYQS